MQIRTLFHNADFLNTSTLKAGRRLVCVLLMLVACTGAVWGTMYRKNPAGSDVQWNSNWQYFTGTDFDTQKNDNSYWTNASSAPRNNDYIVLFKNTKLNEIQMYGGDGITNLHIISNDENETWTLTVAGDINIEGIENTHIKLIVENVNINNTADSGGTAGVKLNQYEAVGCTVEIQTNAEFKANNIFVGMWNSGYRPTTTVFSGTGSFVVVKEMNFPNGNQNDHPDTSFTIDSGTTLKIEEGGNLYTDGTAIIEIGGSGTLDIENVNITSSENNPVTLAPELNIPNAPASPDSYTFTVTGLDTFTGSASDSDAVTVKITSTVAGKIITYSFLRSETSAGQAKFEVNGHPDESGSATFSSGNLEKNWPIKAVESLNVGDGFTLTVYRPDGFVLGSVSWTKTGVFWTGAVSNEWEDPDNWSGAAAISELADKDITIDTTCSRMPVISTGTSAVKSLTIAAGATVTQTGGTLTAGSMTCEAGGTFTATGGTVSFNGTAGTWSDADGNSVFSSVAISAGTLTLSSPLHLIGDFDGSGGSLVQGTNAVIFEGSGTQSLLGSTTLSLVTVESGTTLDCNGNMLSVSGTFKNSGTVNCPGGMLSCGTYTPASDLSDIVSVSGNAVLVTTNGVISKIKVTDTATLSGTPNCRFFEATGLGGKTLTVNGSVTVGSGVTGTAATQTLQLSGTSTGSKLGIAGSGQFKLNATQIGGQYLDVTGMATILDASGGTSVSFTATYSTGPATVPAGWNICAGSLVYTWAGTAGSQDWNNAANWSVGVVPSAISDVLLPSGCVECLTPGTATTIKTLTIETNAPITLLGDLTVTEGISNDHCLDTNGNTLTFETYTSPSGDGLVVLYEDSSLVATTTAASAGTIDWLEITESVTFGNVDKLSFGNVSVTDADSTLTLSDDFTLTGTLSNAGTINTNGHKLTVGSYADTSASRTAVIQVSTADALAVYSGGTGGAIKNLEFTGTGEFAFTDIDGLSFENVTVGSGVNLTLNAISAHSNVFTIDGNLTNNGKVKLGGNVTVTGTVDNNNSINCDNRILTAGAYTHTANASGDEVQANGGSIILTGDGAYTISKATLNASAKVTYNGNGSLLLKDCTVSGFNNSLTVTNNGNGSLTLDATTFYADGKITQSAASGKELPVFTTITVRSGYTLTLNSALTAGTLINNGTVSSAGYDITCTTYTPSASAADSMTLSGDVTLDTGTNTVSTINFSAGTLTPGASELKAGTLNVTSGTTELAGTLDVTTLNVSGGSVTISGMLEADEAVLTGGSHTIASGASVSAGTYKATGLGGQTFTVNGTLEVYLAGTSSDPAFKLEGTSETSRLSVGGSGTIKMYESQIGGQFLSVSTAGPVIRKLDGSDSVIYTATYSIPSGTTAIEFNGWYLCDGNLIYKWKGTTSASWTEPTNWSVRSVPRSSSDVEIPDVSVAGGSVTVENSEAVTINSLSIAENMTLTLGANVTVTGTQNNGKLINSGTINTNGKTLTFKKYEDGVSGERLVTVSGANAFGTPTGTDTSSITNLKFISSVTDAFAFTDVDKLTIVNAEVTSGVTVTVNARSGQSGLTFTGCLTNNGTLKLNTDLTLDTSSGGTDAGKLINNGTISMLGHSLRFVTYSGSGSDKINIGAAGTLIPTSASNAGTVSNLYFWGSRDFADVPALTFKNGWITTAGDTVSFTTDIAFTETFTSNGTVSLDGHNLTAKKYAGTGGYIITNSVEIESTGSDEDASGCIEKVTSSGNATFTQTGSYVIKNLVAGSGASDSGPLTLAAANTTVVNLTIMNAATVNAGSSAASTNKLTVRGNFINLNTTSCSPENPVYNGFVPQNGEVIITGAGSSTVSIEGVPKTAHKVSGNIKFYDFTCTTADAVVAFDAKAIINVDHQINITGNSGQLIDLTVDDATITSDSDKWTLDVVWDVEAGTLEHPRPIISYVAPHKSSSYSAILKGCLVGCVDDANDLHDSTNVNWFDDMPTILMTIAPVGGKQLFVLFSTEVSAAPSEDLRTGVALKSATISNLIDPAAPVTTYTGISDKSKTAVVFGLTRELTWDDLFGSDSLHVEINRISAVRVRNTRISYQQGVKHCASDFAVNAARMLFGYDNFIDSSTPLTIEKGTNSVRVWDQSVSVSNRLHSDSDLLFQSQFDTSVPSGIKLEMIAQLTSQLNESVIGDNYRNYYNLDTRLWLPSAFLPLSSLNQTVPAAQKIAQDSTSSGCLSNFTLHFDRSSSSPLFQMKDGEEIQFLLKVKNADDSDFEIVHEYIYENGSYTPVSGPLYVIRLVDDADITSFDLWSVMLQSTTMQRGNVTILNNVINADNREQTFVTVELQKAGSLTVQVLTLDGSVITTLQRGRKQPGTYGYSWDGTNGKGRPVARGMYFIRVIGPDIDETRKVMVVRN